MTTDYISIPMFIIIFGGGFICGILITSALYEVKSIPNDK